MSFFCRHNRFTADCPICSKGTVLEGGRRSPRRSAGRAERRKAAPAASQGFSGPHVSAGPYVDGEGSSYHVRLERVPGGVRLAEWGSSGLRRRAPVMRVGDLPALIEGASGVLAERDAARLSAALSSQPVRPESGEGGAAGVSRGRSGDFKDELRVEPLGEGLIRIGRWVLRPGSGWELQEAPPMLPAARYGEALADAARRGLPVSASGAGGAARP